jgi:hypothetical protein
MHGRDASPSCSTLRIEKSIAISSANQPQSVWSNFPIAKLHSLPLYLPLGCNTSLRQACACIRCTTIERLANAIKHWTREGLTLRFTNSSIHSRILLDNDGNQDSGIISCMDLRLPGRDLLPRGLASIDKKEFVEASHQSVFSRSACPAQAHQHPLALQTFRRTFGRSAPRVCKWMDMTGHCLKSKHLHELSNYTSHYCADLCAHRSAMFIHGLQRPASEQRPSSLVRKAGVLLYRPRRCAYLSSIA